MLERITLGAGVAAFGIVLALVFHDTGLAGSRLTIGTGLFIILISILFRNRLGKFPLQSNSEISSFFFSITFGISVTSIGVFFLSLSP